MYLNADLGVNIKADLKVNLRVVLDGDLNAYLERNLEANNKADEGVIFDAKLETNLDMI